MLTFVNGNEIFQSFEGAVTLMEIDLVDADSVNDVTSTLQLQWSTV